MQSIVILANDPVKLKRALYDPDDGSLRLETLGKKRASVTLTRAELETLCEWLPLVLAEAPCEVCHTLDGSCPACAPLAPVPSRQSTRLLTLEAYRHADE